MMKKGIKLTAASFLAISALTPVAVFANENETQVEPGIYHANGYIPFANFIKLSIAEKVNYLNDDLTVVVSGTNAIKGTTILSGTNEQIQQETKTVADYQAENGVELTPGGVKEITAQLKVASVRAINLKEINVKFNNELDKDSAENTANYTLSAGTTVSDAELSSDNKTVILTLAAPAAQQAEVDVTVKNVLDTNGQKVAETKKSVKFFDTVAPVAEKVEVVGPKTLKVTFSEPLATVPSFKLNGGAYSVTVNPAFSAGDKEITLVLGATLPEGIHDLEVSGGSDYATFAVEKTNLSFEYVTDKSAPTVSVDKANETKVTLKFNKPVKATGLNTDITVYHTINNAAGYKGVLSAKDADANGYSDTYEATFTTPIPAGSGKTLFLNTKENKFEDLWGNDVESTALSFDIVSDTVAPSVVKAEATGKGANAQKELTITFDEDVLEADAINKANYVLKDANGNVVKTTDFADVDNNGKFNAGASLSYNSDKNEVKISFTNVLKAGNYKLEVSNIKDTSFAGNKMATQTVNLTVEDKIAPTVGNITHDSANNVIYVNFSEAMNGTDLANASNYGLLIGGASKSLPSGSVVEVVSPQKVKITIPDDATYPASGNTVKVQVVGSVKDLAGNEIGGLFGESTDSITWGTDSTFTITPAADQVKLVSKNQLQFELDTELSAIDSTKFSVTATGTPGVASATYVNNAGKSTVTVTLDKDLATTDLTSITELAIAADGLTNAEGLKLNATAKFEQSSGHFEDKLAPSVKEVKTTDVNEITITFSEDLRAGDVSNLTFAVEGNTVASVDNTSNADKVVITLEDNIDTDATPKVTQTLDVRDAAGNVLAAGSNLGATVDGVAPVALSATEDQDAKVITLTFSEALDADTVKAANFTGSAGTPTVEYTAGSKTVTLTYDTALDDGKTIIVGTGVKDVAGNEITQTTFTRDDAVAGSGTYTTN